MSTEVIVGNGKESKIFQVPTSLFRKASKSLSNELDVLPSQTSTANHINSTLYAHLDDQPLRLDSSPLTANQHRYLLTNLRKSKKVKTAHYFLQPVDRVALDIPTTYSKIITHPMDLSLMEEKLKTNSYATADDFMVDFNLIYRNSVAFNGPSHIVTDEAQKFREYFHQVMKGLPKMKWPRPKHR
jgi:hypothetical protein